MDEEAEIQVELFTWDLREWRAQGGQMLWPPPHMAWV